MTNTLDALRRGDLAGSRSLRLSCGLTELPREILGLADTLEVLDLSGNALDTLPDDFARLGRLRVLFCSGNRFTRMPPVLGGCAALTQIGFRGTGLHEVPDEALPPDLRWLTLTDNRIETLPASLGQRPALQKLMLSGNRLTTLPATMAGAPSLELIRLAANQFEALPGWLPELPRLAWLAWAGNPLDRRGIGPVRAIDWPHVALGPLLGEGASGRVYRADWRPGGHGDVRPMALKMFRTAMTSDGLPELEIAACLAAGEHPHLVGATGQLAGHPDGGAGLLMPLLPAGWRPLAGPPSLETCSRDVYEASWRLDLDAAIRIAVGIGAAMSHLHTQGLLHGDLYAHNILWDGDRGDAKLSDFGAASFLPGDASDAPLKRIEVRAWALLLGELLDRSVGDAVAIAAFQDLQRRCVQADPSDQPALGEALDALTSALRSRSSRPMT